MRPHLLKCGAQPPQARIFLGVLLALPTLDGGPLLSIIVGDLYAIGRADKKC